MGNQDVAVRIDGHEPFNHFKYVVYDNAVPRQDVTWRLNVYRTGDISIKLGDELFSFVTITDETLETETIL